jgi:hypothetical protein
MGLHKRLYIGLLHYPVYNRHYQIIASAITNVDLHDLSRLARTCGVTIFFVITPLQDQRELAQRILRHWTEGFGAQYNRYRKEALELIRIVSSLQEAQEMIEEQEGDVPIVIATGASGNREESISYSQTKQMIDSEKAVFILFGTAWGLEKTVIDQSDYMLQPIEGCTRYNHLSVRSAAAIILDRLTGKYD